MYYGQCPYVMEIVHEIFSKKIFWKKNPNTMKNVHVIWPMSIKYWTFDVHGQLSMNTVKQKDPKIL